MLIVGRDVFRFGVEDPLHVSDCYAFRALDPQPEPPSVPMTLRVAEGGS